MRDNDSYDLISRRRVARGDYDEIEKAEQFNVNFILSKFIFFQAVYNVGRAEQRRAKLTRTCA